MKRGALARSVILIIWLFAFFHVSMPRMRKLLTAIGLLIISSISAGATPIKMKPIAVAASSQTIGNPPINAIDGDATTRWSPSSSG